jgi:hypothetical protein
VIQTAIRLMVFTYYRKTPLNGWLQIFSNDKTEYVFGTQIWNHLWDETDGAILPICGLKIFNQT